MNGEHPLPTTDAEPYRWVSRQLVCPTELLAAYAGRPTSTGQTGAMGGTSPGYSWSVEGREVHYRFDGGPTGTVRIRALVR